jgi:hypothetical protein
MELLRQLTRISKEHSEDGGHVQGLE